MKCDMCMMDDSKQKGQRIEKTLVRKIKYKLNIIVGFKDSFSLFFSLFILSA